jgi:DNA mismatch endonuclease (patch repair protein)
VTGSSSDRMRRIARRDTDCELRLRSRLHSLGLRYRVDHLIRGIGTKPDIVFKRAKLAIFIDGCYWHGCPKHGTIPKTNTAFWLEKIKGNRDRDERLTQSLVLAGWLVLRLWSHESLDVMVDRVRVALRL